MMQDWVTHNVPFDVSRDAERFEQREWLLTNGTGSYAMGTALGVNTRRYHGLLIAATQPPVGRIIALSQLLETLVLTEPDGTQQRLEFGTCRFTDSQHQAIYAPMGWRYLERFERGLSVAWHYRFGELRWSRRLVLHDQEPAISVTYQLPAPRKNARQRMSLEVRPMLTLRDFHALRYKHEGAAITLEAMDEAGLSVSAGGYRVSMRWAGEQGACQRGEDWWYSVHYPVDRERGQGDREDYYTPGYFVAQPDDQGLVTLTATLGHEVSLADRAGERRAIRLKPMRAALGFEDTQDAARRKTLTALAIAADDFVVQRTVNEQKLSTVLAGYPWFADWGRDTFIALPGLLLETGRTDEARKVLQAFGASLRNGLVPNRFDDHDAESAHYNNVDGSMWFVHAALQYAQRVNAYEPWLLDAVCAVLDGHLDGTRADGHDGRPIPVRCDADGLITAGDDHTQLTWMDAACWMPEGRFAVFTPRPGKPVEVNALWVSNLRGVAETLSIHASRDAAMQQRKQRYLQTAHRAAASFLDVFWCEPLGHLRDHVRPDGSPDDTLRPNQLLACSLERSPLDAKRKQQVIEAVTRELLTPAGLRTLPARHHDYHAHYGGPQHRRDASYHQGTVWPWLLGPYCEGLLRAYAFNEDAKRRAASAIEPLLRSLTDADDAHAAWGQLHEIHDAEPMHGTHLPRGCPAQAWSVAEVLRVHRLEHP